VFFFCFELILFIILIIQKQKREKYLKLICSLELSQERDKVKNSKKNPIVRMEK